MLLEPVSDTGRLLGRVVAEQVLEPLAALLHPDEPEPQRGRAVADHVVDPVVAQHDLERVRVLAELIAMRAQVGGEAERDRPPRP